MKDLLIDLVVEYNYERKLEAIARDEKTKSKLALILAPRMPCQ